MTVPYWVQDAIFYQIFPDRFANGDRRNDPPNMQPWGSKPTLWDFQGGDLRGIVKQLNYLLDLGINAIYLNPIFLSPSNHRYNTSDYYVIDPRLGGRRDFDALLDVAHANGIRVMLDGVFNHCSRGFFAFVDVLENQEHSAYSDWFHVNDFPVEAYSAGKAESYLGWWGYKSLPKFNTDNQALRSYILDVAGYWVEQGIDGWRLDVPNEIDDDAFWAEFRQVVKDKNPDAYLVGEIWNSDPRWVGDDHFDGLMNYPLREALLDLLTGNSLTVSGFKDRIDRLLKAYPRANTYAMYNPLGSHDTERIRTLLGPNLDKLKLAFAFNFAFLGAPAIYYGDEIGLSGGKDPDCRGAFPWDKDEWQAELHAYVKRLISVRKRRPALRRGDYLPVFVDDRSQSFAFGRTLGDENILVAINAGSTQRYLRIPVGELGWMDGQITHNLLGHEEYLVSGDSLTVRLPAWGSAWIG